MTILKLRRLYARQHKFLSINRIILKTEPRLATIAALKAAVLQAVTGKIMNLKTSTAFPAVRHQYLQQSVSLGREVSGMGHLQLSGCKFFPEK